MKKKIVLSVVSVVIVVLIAVLVVNAITLSGRLTYSSKSEMVEDLNGVWVSRLSNGTIRSKLVIDKGNVTYYFYLHGIEGELMSTSERNYSYEDIQFNHSRGYFKVHNGTYGKYIVKSNGNIINTDKDWEYKKISS